MHPFVHSSLLLNITSLLPSDMRSKERRYLGHDVDEEEEDIYYGDNSKEIPKEYFLDILYLGKWKKSATQHIEVADPVSFFKGIPKYRYLKFVSLRGISLIEELPKFVTMHEKLEFLDLNACHNLEVIPSTIANLQNSLTHLDMSNCYFLNHMPKALASLKRLEVLKGFFVGETRVEDSCTLEDLGNMELLRKLNIYTSLKEFPNRSQLRTLQAFQYLSSLTISWGGCSIRNGKYDSSPVDEEIFPGDDEVISFKITKLYLQCVPESVTRRWLKPTNFRGLKRLYIRGGTFCDLGQLSEGNQWNVKILRLKYLRLCLDWDELHCLFPELICFENVQCPNLDQFPCDENGLWTKSSEMELLIKLSV